MEETLERFRKKASAIATLSKLLQRLGKAAAKEPKDHVSIMDLAQKALRTLEGLQGLDALLAEVRLVFEAALSEASKRVERESAELAGRVASLLQEQGFVVEGHWPVLRAGPFSLEFDFGERPRVVIWFGPRKEKLATLTAEPEALVSKVVALHKGLFSPFDETAFLAELERAYRICLSKFLLPEGERVPITALMTAVAFLRQDERFLAEPRREHFRSLTRAEFAAALSMLRNLRVGTKELRLEVATMSQTRKPVDHLWIPRGPEGMNISYATFVRVEQGVVI